MKCPKCNSEKATKNGRRRGKQCYKCLNCPKGYREAYGRQFVESPIERSYPPEVRQRERISVLVSEADTGAKHRPEDVSQRHGAKAKLSSRLAARELTLSSPEGTMGQ